MPTATDVVVQRLSRLVDQGMNLIPAIITVCVMVVVIWVAKRLTTTAVRKAARRTGRPAGTVALASRLAAAAVITVGALATTAVVVPDITVGSMFGALGIGSVAIGFAFKDILQNLLAGLLILFTRPFRIGDQIVSGSHEGTVEHIQVRATLLRTYDNRQVVIPNGDLYTGRMTVNTAYPTRRVSIPIVVDADHSVDEVKAVLLQASQSASVVLADPLPTVFLTELSDGALGFEIRVWIAPPTRSDVVQAKDEVLCAVAAKLADAGIEFPRPKQDVVVHRHERG